WRKADSDPIHDRLIDDVPVMLDGYIRCPSPEPPDPGADHARLAWSGLTVFLARQQKALDLLVRIQSGDAPDRPIMPIDKVFHQHAFALSIATLSRFGHLLNVLLRDFEERHAIGCCRLRSRLRRLHLDRLGLPLLGLLTSLSSADADVPSLGHLDVDRA